MYQIKWDKVIPSMLSKIVGSRVVRAHGNHFACCFSLDFKNGSTIQFISDDLIQKDATQFEIILNREKIYNPYHFDSSDVFTHNLGKIIAANEYRTNKRKNAREIHIYFNAESKYYKLQDLIYQALRFIYSEIDVEIAGIIGSFLQPKTDKMMIRAFKKIPITGMEEKNAKLFHQIKKQRKYIQKIFRKEIPESHSTSVQTTDDSNEPIFSLYPIQSNLLTLEAVHQTTNVNGRRRQTEENENNNEIEIRNGRNVNENENINDNYFIENEEEEEKEENRLHFLESLYPIHTSMNDKINVHHSNTRVMNDDQNMDLRNYEIGSSYAQNNMIDDNIIEQQLEDAHQEIMRQETFEDDEEEANVSESCSKKGGDWKKIYCDVACKIAVWNTFSATRKRST